MDAATVGACGSAAALVLIVALAPCHPPAHPPEVAGLGTIVQGSIVRIGPWKHRLTLEHPFAIDRGWPSDETIDVVVIGELPDTVCDRTQVYVRGTKTANGLVATVVQADRGKYDGCFQWHCHPFAYEACRGGTNDYP